jgi:hypothetical protein
LRGISRVSCASRPARWPRRPRRRHGCRRAIRSPVTSRPWCLGFPARPACSRMVDSDDGIDIQVQPLTGTGGRTRGPERARGQPGYRAEGRIDQPPTICDSTICPPRHPNPGRSSCATPMAVSADRICITTSTAPWCVHPAGTLGARSRGCRADRVRPVRCPGHRNPGGHPPGHPLRNLPGMRLTVPTPAAAVSSSGRLR